METFETNDKPTEPLIINDEIKSYLLTTSKWAKFLSILAFIGIGFIVILAIAFFFLSSSFSTPPNFPFGLGFFGVIYLAIGLLYFFPVYYLLKFSDNIKQGLKYNEQSVLDSGFGYLKSHFKYLGILIIVVFSIYLLMLIAFGLFFHSFQEMYHPRSVAPIIYDHQ
jgi:hypothetical protein